MLRTEECSGRTIKETPMISTSVPVSDGGGKIDRWRIFSLTPTCKRLARSGRAMGIAAVKLAGVPVGGNPTGGNAQVPP